MKNFLIQFNILLLIIIIWLIIFELKIFSPLLLPSPQRIFVAFLKIFLKEKIYIDLEYSLGRLFAGLALGSSFGLIIGFLISLSPRTVKFTSFWLDFLRSLPYVALVPIFMLFFGIGEQAKILLIAFVSLTIMALNTIQALKNINQTRILMAQSLGLNRLQIFSKIILPESLAYISAGVRHLISFALIIVIVSEMFMSTKIGLGKRIINYHLLFSID